jgi:SAM-dependent methyltransferase
VKRAGPLRQGLRRLLRPARLGVLHRTRPLSDFWGFDRGTPVDRHYIESFLAGHREDVRGRVLEVQDSLYTDRFGTAVERRDVLDVDAKNPRATIVADLAAADTVPSGLFDCFILTQTLHLIYDTRAALGHARRLLRPGGVLLATLPAVSRVTRGAAASDYWRFTPASAAALFGEAFGPGSVSVHSYGNVLTAVAFLSGMAREELSARELETRDEHFPVVIAVRAVKA